MRDALNATGRHIYYSIHGPVGVPDIANTWRTTGDIGNSWSSILSTAIKNAQKQEVAQPGAFSKSGPIVGDDRPAHGLIWFVVLASALLMLCVQCSKWGTSSTLWVTRRAARTSPCGR